MRWNCDSELGSWGLKGMVLIRGRGRGMERFGEVWSVLKWFGGEEGAGK